MKTKNLIFLRCFLLIISLSSILFLNIINGQILDTPVFVFPENDFERESLEKYVQFVSLKEGNLINKDSIDEFSLKFVENEIMDSIRLGSIKWGLIRMQNPSEVIQSAYLVFGDNIDSLKLYQLIDNELKTVGAVKEKVLPKENYITTSTRIIPLSLFPEDSTTFFFRIYSSSQSSLSNMVFGIQIYQGKYFINSILNKRSFQIFGESLTIFLGLISLFVFFVFKSRDFLFFSIVIFLLVFLVGGEVGLINTASFNPLKKNFIAGNGTALVPLIFGGLIFFGTLFISTNLELKKHWKKFRKYYLISGALFGFLTCVMSLLLRDGKTDAFFFFLLFFLLLVLFMAWVALSFIAIIQGTLKKRGNAYVLLFSFLLLGIVPLLESEVFFSVFNKSSIGGFTLSSLLPFFLTIMYGLFTKVSKIRKAQISTQIEKEKSEELLFNILPEEIATELIEKGESKAKLIDQVSVLFTDFEGFTKKAAKLSPQELVEEINVCFKAFDEIIQKYDIEKIKTIGDAYMAAGGLRSPDPRPGVIHVIKAAMEMKDFILERKAYCLEVNKAYFEMRVGVHTGPIVAGVVGVKKFQYDIWGDTVNTASRMESNGKIGKLNISHTTHELIKDDPQFKFENRGKIKAKGKGEIEMWFVEEA